MLGYSLLLWIDYSCDYKIQTRTILISILGVQNPHINGSKNLIIQEKKKF